MSHTRLGKEPQFYIDKNHFVTLGCSASNMDGPHSRQNLRGCSLTFVFSFMVQGAWILFMMKNNYWQFVLVGIAMDHEAQHEANNLEGLVPRNQSPWGLNPTSISWAIALLSPSGPLPYYHSFRGPLPYFHLVGHCPTAFAFVSWAIALLLPFSTLRICKTLLALSFWGAVIVLVWYRMYRVPYLLLFVVARASSLAWAAPHADYRRLRHLY